MKNSSVGRFAAVFGLLLCLVLPASATWSIVTINVRTGEVGVASATCLANFNLERGTPVIVVGRGAGVAQASLDSTGVNRQIIWTGIRGRVQTPQEILDTLAMEFGHETRQYGIVALTGPPVTFTGSRNGGAATGVTGQIGDYVYAIQGNVLAGKIVVKECEKAFRSTNGDMGQRLMAAMQAARAFGGDGRCSCDQNRPTSCGAPPPSFTKSAHSGFLIVARSGDMNGTCNRVKGCASGTYYLDINIAGAKSSPSSPDPVDQIQSRYDTWRLNQAGHPDGILSRVTSVQSMPADGVTQRTVTIQLVDIDGVDITTGGANVVVTPKGAGGLTTIGAVTDHGDGTYSFPLTAGTTPGNANFNVLIDDGVVQASLQPALQVRLDPVQPLHVGYDQVSASEAPTVPFVLNEPGRAGVHYLILASLNGTQPGGMLGDVALPLNPPFISVLRHGVDAARLPGTLGVLDDSGRAEGSFASGTPALLSLIGQRLDWAAVLFGPGGRSVTNAVGFDIVP
ncbi:MAG TPA: DUF1028 domain-containing protein [Planctomycetes bacterium]|nr:DUF1028 domain-containing protein [Planctomycetota bacterium]